jgi:hypothetical protein
MPTNIFAIDTLDYDADRGYIVAYVYLARSYLDPDTEQDVAGSPEVFNITINLFARDADLDVDRVYVIEDCTAHAGYAGRDYPPLVMAAFIAEWSRLYSASGGSDPASVQPFRFSVTMNLPGQAGTWR